MDYVFSITRNRKKRIKRGTLLLFVCLGLIFCVTCKKISNCKVLLISPENGAVVGLTVTFSWRIEDCEDGSYRAKIYLDKGADPFDGNIEEMFEAEPGAFSRTVTLDAARYGGQRVEWGVEIINGGTSYKSGINGFHVEAVQSHLHK